MGKSFLIPPIAARALGLDYLQKSGDERPDSPNVTLHPLNELPIKSGGQHWPVHSAPWVRFCCSNCIGHSYHPIWSPRTMGGGSSCFCCSGHRGIFWPPWIWYFSGMLWRNTSAIRGQDWRPGLAGTDICSGDQNKTKMTRKTPEVSSDKGN